MNKWQYDLAIVGAGASGLIAADFAVTLGARVALLEKDRIGGDCTWSGCVPSKSLIKVASIAQSVRTSGRYGIEARAAIIDMARVREYLRSTIQHIYAPTTPDALREKGMNVLLGAVSFVDRHTLQVGADRITANKILINTGAHPALPDLPGLDETPYSTYLQIFENEHLPERMIVIGGGPVGCEVAQAYRRLGAEVSIIAENLLPREDAEVSEVLKNVFAGEGIRLVQGRATAVRQTAEEIVISTQAQEISGDFLFVAAGRCPVLADLNLDAARVTYSAKGIEVNRYLETSVRNIFAAGDVIGGPQYSHLAGWQGFQAARNALLPGRSYGLPRAMPRVTFTIPEVAQVGLTEREARERFGARLQIDMLDLGKVDRAVSEDDRHGFLKIIAYPNGRIAGASIVGERASEAITELVIAMQKKLTIRDLAGIVHPYPTYAIGVQFLATQMAMKRTFDGRRGKLLRLTSQLYR